MKKVVWIILIVILVGVVGYLYVFHKPHRDIAGEKAEIELASAALVEEYSANQQTADAKYLDKVVELDGIVAEHTSEGLKLQEGVFCSMLPEDTANRPNAGARVRVKGRVVGYDELFEEVKLDNCQFVD